MKISRQPLARLPGTYRTRIIGAVFQVLCGCLAFTLPARALDYTLDPPPSEVTADLAVSFTLTSEEAIRLEPAPAHPRIQWLPATVRSGKQNKATFRFVPRGVGTISPPPVPVLIGDRRILLRLPKLTILPNSQPAGATEMIVLWNGKRRQPETLRIGQMVNLEILALTPASVPTSQLLPLADPTQSLPSMEIEPARWYRASIPGNITTESLRFYRFGFRIYEEQQTVFRGKKCRVRRYKTRLTVIPGDRLKGTIALTLGNGKSKRTHLETVDLPIAALPPVPGGTHTPTGLLGDWSFEATIDPAEPGPSQPFTITLDIEGTGDPNLLHELDFSRSGIRSVSSKLETLDESNFDRHHARFTQTLVSDGSTTTFPAIKLLSFDTPGDAWQVRRVTEPLHFDNPAAALLGLAPGRQLGKNVRRPILLNLHPAAFAAFGLAPLLAMFAGLVARQRKKRDPARCARRRMARQLLRELERADADAVPGVLEDQWLVLLRSHCELPAGASTREVADALDAGHPELAALLRAHADTAFVGSPSPATRQSLAPLLARISFSILLLLGLCPGNARAGDAEAALDAAALDFAGARYESAATRYRELLEAHPGHPELHRDLARVRLADGRLQLARASAHTAFLLDPLNKESRQLLDTTHRRLGAPPLPGSAALALRPDQLLTLGVAAWGLAFLLLAVRGFIAFPRWPFITCFVAAALFLAIALWRNTHAYAPDQFMVVVHEVRRETEPGKPDFDRPPLTAGAILRAAGANESGSHLRIETPDTSFWLPAGQLQQVW